MRMTLATLAVIGVAACAGPVPDSGAPADAPLPGTASTRAPLAATTGPEASVQVSALPPADGAASAGGAASAPVAGAAAGQTPGLVAYALSNAHPVGAKRYRRGLFALAALSERKCRKFPSDDAAQEAFLAAGGPERDRLNLDPDGDGYACGWDPAPFRQMAAAVRR